MPPSIVLKGGAVKIANRTTNIHPDAWDPKLSKFSPLGQWPLTTVLDKIGSGQIPSRVFHWFEKPFNSLTGSISDTYTTSGLVTAVTGATASGTTVYIKPDAAGFAKLRNMRENDNIEIYSGSVYGRISGYTTAVHIGTVDNSYFSFVLNATDSSEVLAGTSLVWTITGRGEEELHELPDSVSEHETEYYNYVSTMLEAFKASEDEINELSRLDENYREELEMDALHRLNQRREFQLLEGVRSVRGDIYNAGGLRWFLEQYEPTNIINWRTDTTYSASTDTVLGGSIPFLKRLSERLREFSPAGTRKMMVCSQRIRGVIDECVINSGMYNIGYETNKYGLHVAVLRGLDNEIELLEEPLFNGNTAKKNTVYIIEPALIKRKTVKDGNLHKIPWSELNQSGDLYKSYTEGGWRVKETYQFLRLQSHCIIENFGIDKA
jgi:hypothetical protein